MQDATLEYSLTLRYRGLANAALSLGDLDAPMIEDRQILNQWWGTSIYLFASPTEFNSEF